MMTKSDHVLKLYDKNGHLQTVMLSADLWQRGGHALADLVNSLCGDGTTCASDTSEPLDQWDDFKKMWDFKYPYEARVECKGCGAAVEDWTTDPDKRFRLKSAQLGGLAVFTCSQCGATVRKKHFKDHMCFEFSPKLK